MGPFDNEIEIIKAFQMIQANEVLLLPETDKQAEEIYLSIVQKWDKWTNSSRKSDPPPDFFSNELGFMMEVMRVDDHGHIGRNGKSIINPTLERESEVMQELKKRGILDAAPKAKVRLNVDTKLPTDEDHNYSFYRDNFNRIVGSHIKKIANYRENHPGLQTIFMIFDESSPYFETLDPHTIGQIGKIQSGKPHWWFIDNAFMRTLKNSDVDYLVWFTPYKHCDMFSLTGDRMELPKATVMNIESISDSFVDYDSSKMMSSEL